jgi:hypothetical protein
VRKTAELILVVLGSSIVALVIGFILAGIGASGVIGVTLTHALFWAAFAVAILGASIASWSVAQSWKHAAMGLMATALVVGSGLIMLDRWLHTKKTEQDAANQPPPVLSFHIPSPRVPVIKTPKLPEIQKAKPSVNIEQHDTGNGAVGGNITAQPCSAVQVGGNGNTATINCVPSYWRLEQKSLETLIEAFRGGVR